MKTKDQKIQIAKEAQNDIKNSKIVVFTDFVGMTVEDMNGLRKNLLENDSKFKVIKNALIDIAAQKEGYKTEIKKSKTQTAVLFGYSDEVVPAKTLVEFIKQFEKPKILGGLYQGKYITKEEIEKLSTIPSKKELEAKLVGTIAGPMTGFLNVLQGNLRGLVSVLSQYQNQINK